MLASLSARVGSITDNGSGSLTADEQKLMDESASHVAELVDVVKKLAPDLG